MSFDGIVPRSAKPPQAAAGAATGRQRLSRDCADDSLAGDGDDASTGSGIRPPPPPRVAAGPVASTVGKWSGEGGEDGAFNCWSEAPADVFQVNL